MWAVLGAKNTTRPVLGAHPSSSRGKPKILGSSRGKKYLMPVLGAKNFLGSSRGKIFFGSSRGKILFWAVLGAKFCFGQFSGQIFFFASSRGKTKFMPVRGGAGVVVAKVLRIPRNGSGLLCPRIQFCPRRHVVRHTPLYLSNNYRSAAAAGRSMTRESTLVPGLNLKAPQAFCVLTGSG